MPRDDCKDALDNEVVDESQFCAVDNVKETDSCHGDSGGPLQILDSIKKTGKVIGIVSYGDDTKDTGIDCANGDPGIYTNVAYFVDWIESVVWPKIITTN